MNKIARILPVREQDRIISDFLRERLDTILPISDARSLKLICG